MNEIRNDHSLICGENGLVRCQVSLRLAPQPYDARMPYLINSVHYFARLVVVYLNRGLKHVTIRQTLSELRQKFWICRSRGFVRKLLKDFNVCRKYEGHSFQYLLHQL